MSTALLSTPTTQTHPFTSIRPVAELEAYLLTLLPASLAGDDFWCRTARRYARGIATYYAGHPTTAPACTLANVVATMQAGNLAQVLTMLASYPESWQEAQHLIIAHEQGAHKQLEGALTILTANLSFLRFEHAAREINRFLQQFQPVLSPA